MNTSGRNLYRNTRTGIAFHWSVEKSCDILDHPIAGNFYHTLHNGTVYPLGSKIKNFFHKNKLIKITRMKSQMDFKSTRSKETFATLVTLMRPDSSVTPHVINQRISMGKHSIALVTIQTALFPVSFFHDSWSCWFCKFNFHSKITQKKNINIDRYSLWQLCN